MFGARFVSSCQSSIGVTWIKAHSLVRSLSWAFLSAQSHIEPQNTHRRVPVASAMRCHRAGLRQLSALITRGVFVSPQWSPPVRLSSASA